MTHEVLPDPSVDGTIGSLPAPERPAWTRLEILGLNAARHHWVALTARAPATPYQNYAWVAAWCIGQGALRERDVAVAVMFDADDRVIGLLPLGIETRWPGRTLQFLGGRDANGSMGLFDPAADWSASAVKAVIAAIASPTGADVMMLTNQPHAWNGVPNPLATLPRQPSPSAGHGMRLGATAEATRNQFSPHARKRFRQRRKKLAALGPVFHERAEEPANAEKVLDAYLGHKAQRKDTTAIRSRDEVAGFRRFMLAATKPSRDGSRAVELHALRCGTEIVATFALATHAGHASGMFVSFDPRPEFARQSPGDQLIQTVMEDLSSRGFVSFDLGIGEARYKETFCPIPMPLFDTFVGLTARGRLGAAVLRAAFRLKTRLKASRLLPLVRRLRRISA